MSSTSTRIGVTSLTLTIAVVMLSACFGSGERAEDVNIVVTTQSAPTDSVPDPTTASSPETSSVSSVVRPPETLAPATIGSDLDTTTTTASVTTTTAPPATTSTTAEVPVTTQATTTTILAAQGDWIAVMASLSTTNYSKTQAEAWRTEIGLPEAKILLSDNHSTLTPGYWVVYEGPFPTHGAAVSVCERHVADQPECYPRPVVIPG